MRGERLSRTQRTADDALGRGSSATKTIGKSWRLPASPVASVKLFDFSRCAGFDQLLEYRVRVGLRHSFFDRFRRGIDEVLGFLQAQAGHCAHDFDHVDLARTRVAKV